MQVMQKAINTCPDSSSKNISNALEQIISCSLWAEKRADTITTKTHQQPAQIAEEQAVKTSIWMQYKETNWIYILWEQRWKAWLQICLITEYNLRCSVLSGMLTCSLQRCCWFLTASRGLAVSAGVVSASSRSAWECELFAADFQALHIQSFVMWKQFKCSAVASDRIIPDYLMLPRFHCVSIAV